MVHDMSSNCTYGILVDQPNVTLALMSKTEVSSDEGQTDAILALDDATLQFQSR